MKRLFTLILITAFCIWSCSDNDSYTIGFFGNSSANETLAEDYKGIWQIALSPDTPAELLEIKKIDQQSWCDLTVMPQINYLYLEVFSVNDTGQERTARFSASAGNSAITYTVTQKTLHTLYISDLDADDSGVYTYRAPFEDADDLVFTIMTSADTWNLEAYSPLLTKWYEIDKTTGVSGDKVRIAFDDNDSSQRNLTLTISADQAYHIEVNILQDKTEAPDIATYFKLFYGDAATSGFQGTEVGNNANLTRQYFLASEYGKDHAKAKFGYETDGVFTVIIGKQAVGGVVEELPEEECFIAVEYDEEHIYIYPKTPYVGGTIMRYNGIQFMGEGGALLTVNMPQNFR